MVPRRAIAPVSCLSHRAPHLRISTKCAARDAGRIIGATLSRSAITASMVCRNRALAAGLDDRRNVSSKIDSTASSGVIGGRGSGFCTVMTCAPALGVAHSHDNFGRSDTTQRRLKLNNRYESRRERGSPGAKSKIQPAGEHHNLSTTYAVIPIRDTAQVKAAKASLSPDWS
jgi:hypothetical protein